MTAADNTSINRIPVREFREFGYLQEINRRFLHRLGMALEVIVEPDCGACGHRLSQHEEEGCRAWAHDSLDNQMACDCKEPETMERLGGIWDYRSDPEGMIFSDGVDPDKATRVQREFDRFGETRQASLGYVTQPVGPTPKRSFE